MNKALRHYGTKALSKKSLSALVPFSSLSLFLSIKDSRQHTIKRAICSAGMASFPLPSGRPAFPFGL